MSPMRPPYRHPGIPAASSLPVPSTRNRFLLSAIAALAIGYPIRPAAAANIETVFTGGFIDPTPVTPVGGNNGTTLGEQRQNAFRAAADVWGATLASEVTIRVRASFLPLTCGPTGAVLGRTGPLGAVVDFPNAPLAETWYHIALANKLAGSDQDPANDDISAQFNSSLDENCLPGTRWYYGLDHQHGTASDFFSVVLHELAHGLGFSTFTDLRTGQFSVNLPDVYAHFILDASLDKHWTQLTDDERLASSVRGGSVVWDGANVTARVPDVLQRGAPRVTVNSPPAIAGELVIGLASFGPAPSAPGVTADLVLAEPDTACSPITNAAAMSGKIALIDRGGCTFASKALAAQGAGAVGVVIVNNRPGSPPAMGGTAPDLTIPVVSISQSDGDRIKARLPGANLTIGFDPDRLAGANDAGKLLLYAPNPVELGSSISHWDPSATPNLLLEPFATPDLGSNLDLTPAAMVDMGWTLEPDTNTAVLVTFVRAHALPDRVRLEWYLADGTLTPALYRRAEGSIWEARAVLAADGAGHLEYEDRDILPGRRYDYRLGIVEGGIERFYGEARVEVPVAPRLALIGIRPGRGGREVDLAFSVPGSDRVRVEFLDVAGRRVLERDLGTLEAGNQLVRLSSLDLASGFYLVRIVQTGRSAAGKAVIVR